MSILDQIKAHSRPTEVRIIEVPEWGSEGAPLRIHHTMVSLGDVEAARSIAKDNPMRQNCEILAMKALNSDGTPMFKRMDAAEMMQVADPEILLRVVNAMTGSTPEQIAKN